MHNSLFFLSLAELFELRENLIQNPNSNAISRQLVSDCIIHTGRFEILARGFSEADARWDEVVTEYINEELKKFNSR